MKAKNNPHYIHSLPRSPLTAANHRDHSLPLISQRHRSLSGHPQHSGLRLAGAADPRGEDPESGLSCHARHPVRQLQPRRLADRVRHPLEQGRIWAPGSPGYSPGRSPRSVGTLLSKFWEISDHMLNSPCLGPRVTRAILKAHQASLSNQKKRTERLDRWLPGSHRRNVRTAYRFAVACS